MARNLPETSAPKPPTIGVLIYTYNGFHRDVVRGITAYAYDRGMVVWMEQRDLALIPIAELAELLHTRRADGYIIQGHARGDLAAAFADAGRPAVAVCGRPPGFAGQMVGLDDHALGVLAARHLQERGLVNLAFIGNDQSTTARLRLAGFMDGLGQRGLAAAHFALRPPLIHQSKVLTASGRRELRHWLRRLPQPAGVFVQSDFHASQAAQVCAEAGIAVPEQVAILGWDDDTFLCETTFPPLSSVRLPGFDIGFEAARRLDRLFHGESFAGDLLLPPLGVVARRSTDVVAIDDPALVAALRFIRARALGAVRVAEIAAAAGISRRALEQRFRRCFGRTPLDEVRRVRIAAAQRLLLETDRPLADIAGDVGFASANSFCAVFSRFVGRPPGRFRAGR